MRMGGYGFQNKTAALVIYRMSPKDIKLISQGLLYFLNICELFL